MDSHERAAAIAAPALAGLLRESHVLPPSRLASAVSAHARSLGAVEAVVYRVDYQQLELIPLPGLDAADRSAMPVDASLAGRAYTSSRALEGGGAPIDSVGRGDPSRRRLWQPLRDGSDRLGVLELTFVTGGQPISPDVTAAAELFATLVAELLVTKNVYGDVIEFVRRTHELSVPAEIQWHLLPPLSFAAPSLSVAGVLEPCESVAGDTFDYAVNGETAHLAVFDAVGHGMRSTMLASVTLGAYRAARRRLLGLTDAHRLIEETLAGADADAFVTGLLCELDLERGVLTWLSAGHHPPLLLRDNQAVKTLDVRPEPPLGTGLAREPSIGCETLQPGDRVLLYTDGIVEARDAAGGFFGIDRLADLVTRELASGHQAPEVLRRLSRSVLDHVDRQLSDDATVLMLEWKGSR